MTSFDRHSKLRLAPLSLAAALLTPLSAHAQDALDELFSDMDASSAPTSTEFAPAGSTPAAVEASDTALDDTVAVVPLRNDPAPATPVPPSGRVIEEIVVTAQKTEQSIQDVPVSVSALDGETLKQSGTFDAGGLENLVSNVEIDIDPQAPVIGIRGFATETDNVGFEPAVGLVMDDLALGRPEFIPDGLFDIERIEVLRGSQGTLFGKNTIAGVITFASTEPEDVLSGNLLASIGDPHQRRIEAGVSVPFGDTVSARLSGVIWDKDGDVNNSTLRRDEGTLTQSAGRIKLVAQPGDRWTLRASTQLSNTSVDYAPWQLYDASANALAFAQRYDASTEDNPRDVHTTFDVPGYVKRRSDVSRLRADYDAGDWLGLHDVTHTAVIGHAGFDLGTIIDIDVSPADVIVTDFGVDYAQDSIELRTAAQADSLFGLGHDVQLVLGLYGLQSDMDSHLDTLAGDDLLAFAASGAGFDALGLPSSVINDLLQLPSIAINDALRRGFSQQTDSYAAFGQITWHFTERWSAIAGLRAGHDRKRAEFDVRSEGLGLVSMVVGASPYTAKPERSESDVSPKLGLQYDWTGDITTFATWTRGYKGGGFNATAESETTQDDQGNTVDNLQFEAERAQSWEAGIKSRLLDGTLTVNATLYRSDIDNLQVVDFTGFSYQVRNAAEARLQGLELDLRWLPPVEWLSINASLGISDANYLRYTNAPPTAPQQADGADSQDLSGKSLANAPDLSASLSPVISVPVGADLLLQWGVDASYRGDQYSATDLDAHSFQSGYWLFGSRISIGAGDGRWALIVAGSNLTDERALDLVMDHSVYSDTYIAQQIPLRSVTASLQASWY